MRTFFRKNVGVGRRKDESSYKRMDYLNEGAGGGWVDIFLFNRIGEDENYEGSRFSKYNFLVKYFLKQG